MSKGLFSDTDPKLMEKFRKFHTENPQVFERFLGHSRLIRSRGWKKYSPVTIINVMRWETDLCTTATDFKINNDFIAIYARLAMLTYPKEFEDFFNIRKMKPNRKISVEEAIRNESKY